MFKHKSSNNKRLNGLKWSIRTQKGHNILNLQTYKWRINMRKRKNRSKWRGRKNNIRLILIHIYRQNGVDKEATAEATWTKILTKGAYKSGCI